MRYRLCLPTLLFVLALAGCVSGPKLELDSLADTPQVHRLGDVFLAGQPSPAGLAAARDRGVTRIINLRHGAEMPFDETQLAAELGMDYRALPWNGPNELTDDVFSASRALLNETGSPTLLHCASANRVGAVWIPWRVLDGGISIEAAVDEARTIGMRSPEYEARARQYIARSR